MKTTAEFYLINTDNQTSTFKVEEIIFIFMWALEIKIIKLSFG
jgi:hypothetical protein